MGPGAQAAAPREGYSFRMKITLGLILTSFAGSFAQAAQDPLGVSWAEAVSYISAGGAGFEVPDVPRGAPVGIGSLGCPAFALEAPGDGPRAEECMAEEIRRCGPWGALCGEKLPSRDAAAPNARQEGVVTPLTTGFKGLGSAGKTGKIDGPGKKGNGSYRVGKNDPYELQLVIKTGYIDATLTLTRDPATGKDKMRFQGRLWDQGKGDWGLPQDTANDVVVGYNSGNDEGTLRWQENGKWKSEGFWGGKAGTKMTIEFGGGYNHDFEQD